MVIAPRFTHTNCLHAYTAGPYLGNSSTSNVVGIANAWTVMMSYKPVAGSSVRVLNIGTAANRINILYSANNTIQVITTDAANATLKSYIYSTLVFPNSWNQTTITWDGSTLQLYNNGIAVAPSSILTDNAGTMTDLGRTVGIGATGTGSNPIIGQISQCAVWDAVLSAGEVLDIYNGGCVAQTDLRGPVGAYTKHTNLQHWWLCGYPGNIGKDFGIAGTKIDLTTGSAVESVDTTSEAPTENAYNRWHELYLDMNGVDERMRVVAGLSIGLANTWTNMCWVNSQRDTTQETFFEYRVGGTSPNRIRFQKRGDLTNDPLQIDIYDSAGTVIKDYLFNNVLPVNTWVSVIATWDGTTLLTYINGVLTPPSTLTSNASGTMTATNRNIGWGLGAGADQFCACWLHSAASWNTAISAANAAIVGNPKNARWLNLTRNNFGYTAADSLVQWYRGALGSAVTVSNIFNGNDAVIQPSVATKLNPVGTNITSIDDVFMGGPT